MTAAPRKPHLTKGPDTNNNDVYEARIGCCPNKCSLLDAALVAPQVAALVLHRVATLQQRRLLRLDGGQTLLLPLDAGVRIAQTLQANA